MFHLISWDKLSKRQKWLILYKKVFWKVTGPNSTSISTIIWINIQDLLKIFNNFRSSPQLSFKCKKLKIFFLLSVWSTHIIVLYRTKHLWSLQVTVRSPAVGNFESHALQTFHIFSNSNLAQRQPYISTTAFICRQHQRYSKFQSWSRHDVEMRFYSLSLIGLHQNLIFDNIS